MFIFIGFKNTIYLYIRMLVLMVLSFFSTRIVLDKLGASDYGIQNLVAGFVSIYICLKSSFKSPMYIPINSDMVKT